MSVGAGQTLDKRELWRRIGEVLHYVWDPCQVAGVPQARDEYESYIPRVYAALASGATADELAQILSEIERTQMGTDGSAEALRDVGELLVDWHDHLLSQDI